MLEDETDTGHPVLILTHLTRKGGQERRVVIQRFDLPLRGVITFFVALLPSIVFAVVGFVILGVWGITISFAIVQGLAFWLVNKRTRAGVSLQRSFIDRRESGVGDLFIGYTPIDVDRLTRVATIRVAAVDVDVKTDIATNEVEDLLWAD